MRAWMPASRREYPRGRRRWTTRTPREPLQLRFPTDRTGAETPLSEKTASGSRPRACRERAGRRCRVERPDHEKRDRRSHPEARRGESTTRRLRSSQRGRLPPRQPPSSPIWRSGCQGVGVDGHRLVGCVVDGVRLAGRSEDARVRDGGHAHMRGLSQDLCSSHVRCLLSSAAAPEGGGCSATNRGVAVREPAASGRLASRTEGVKRKVSA